MSTKTFIDIGKMSYNEYAELARCGTNKEFIEQHQKNLQNIIESSKSSCDTASIQKNIPMKWYEEIVPLILLGLGVPGSVFTIPLLLFVIGKYYNFSAFFSDDHHGYSCI